RLRTPPPAPPSRPLAPDLRDHRSPQRLATEALASAPSCRKPRGYPLPDQAALELADGSQDREEQPAAVRAGVDRLIKNHQRAVRLVELLGDVEELAQAPSQAVQ